jgi:hypothetical protein
LCLSSDASLLLAALLIFNWHKDITSFSAQAHHRLFTWAEISKLAYLADAVVTVITILTFHLFIDSSFFILAEDCLLLLSAYRMGNIHAQKNPGAKRIR